MAPSAALALAFLFLTAQSATAQKIEVALPVDLAPPGARSAGMGRAFIGLADDATAAAANPAGLTNLSRPEISYHFRFEQLDSLRPAFEASNGLLTSTTSSVVPAFFSFVMPLQQGRAAWSAFYHQNVKSSFRFREDFARGIGNSYVYGSQDDSELGIGQAGGSFAVSAAGGLMSFGGTVARSFASLDSRSRQFTLVENRLGRSQTLFLDTVDDSDQAWTVSAGFRAQPTRHISIGGVFRSGSSFELELEDRWIFSGNAGQPDSYALSGPFVYPVRIRIPQSYGVGASIKPGSGRTTINLDVVRLRYSQLPPGSQLGDDDQPAIVDGTELHVGAEYGFTLPRQWLLSIRGGVYTDPGHHPYEGTVGPTRARPPLDTSTTHLAAGTGLAIGQMIQLDAAFVRSTQNREFLLSTVVRF